MVFRSARELPCLRLMPATLWVTAHGGQRHVLQLRRERWDTGGGRLMELILRMQAVSCHAFTGCWHFQVR